MRRDVAARTGRTFRGRVGITLLCACLLVSHPDGAGAFVPRAVPSPPLSCPTRAATAVHARRPPANSGGWGRDGRPVSRSRSPVAADAPVLPPLRKCLIIFNVVMYATQLLSLYRYAPVLNAQLARRGARQAMASPGGWVQKAVMGGAGGLTMSAGMGRAIVSSLGPFTTDFFHYAPMTKFQPHRLFTAGLLHGSGLHLLFNMMYLRRVGAWVEGCLGDGLFLTTYVASAAAGNIASWLFNPTGSCLGASGAICGIDGLCYLVLRRMGREKEANRVLTGLSYLLLFGMMSSRVSNSGHFGGFLGGILVAALCGPRFGKVQGRGWRADGKAGASDRRDDEGPAGRPTFKKSRLASVFGPPQGLQELPPLVSKRYFWLGLLGVCGVLPPLRSAYKIPYHLYIGLKMPGSLGGCIPFLPRL